MTLKDQIKERSGIKLNDDGGVFIDPDDDNEVITEPTPEPDGDILMEGGNE